MLRQLGAGPFPYFERLAHGMSTTFEFEDDAVLHSLSLNPVSGGSVGNVDVEFYPPVGFTNVSGEEVAGFLLLYSGIATYLLTPYTYDPTAPVFALPSVFPKGCVLKIINPHETLAVEVTLIASGVATGRY